MRIDKTRRHEQARRIDHPCRRGAGQARANLGDTPPLDRHIGDPRGPGFRVDHGPVDDQQRVHGPRVASCGSVGPWAPPHHGVPHAAGSLHERRQHLACQSMDRLVHRAADRGGISVDFDRHGAGPPGDLDEPRRRVDHRARPDGEEQLAGAARVEGRFDRGGGERLAEPDHIGSEQPPVGRPHGQLRQRHGQVCVLPSRPHAPPLNDVPMEFDDRGAPGSLVQPVDVLREQREPTATRGHQALHRRQGQMAWVRLSLEALGPPEVVPPAHGLGVGGEGLRGGERSEIERCPQPLELVTVGRDAALGRDAGTRDRHHPRCRSQPISDPGHLPRPGARPIRGGIRLWSPITHARPSSGSAQVYIARGTHLPVPNHRSAAPWRVNRA